MAVIGSIRKRTGLLIAVIAVAMFAFLLMDGLASRNRMGGAGNQNVGKIGGQKISAEYFNRAYNEYENRIKTLNANFALDEAGQAQVRDAVWNEIAADVLIGKNFDKMGLQVSDEEVADAMYGSNISQEAQSILVNPQTGKYDPTFAYNLVQNVENGNLNQPEYITLVKELRGLLEDNLLRSKYTNLFNKGMYVPNFLAAEAQKESASTADISYVYFPYYEITDDQVEVSDKDLQNYLSANAAAYEGEATKEVQLYITDIVPSAADTADALEDVKELLEEFKGAKNDSLFVRKYSDVAYDIVYKKADEIFGDENAENYFVDEVGTYYEPTFSNATNSFSVFKLTDRKMLPDSVKASHILLPQPTTIAERDSLIALADSLIEEIKNGASFNDLAAIHSADNSNKDKGGDLGYFGPGRMVKPFNDACFFVYEQGDVFQVPSQFGLHIVRIDRAKPTTPAVRLAEVRRALEYSKQTANDLMHARDQFHQEHNTPSKFETAADGDEYAVTTVTLTPNQTDVAGLGSARDLVQWAFKNKVGTIKGFDVNDKYFVAYIKGETAEGLPSVASLKGELTQKVLEQKKAAYIADQVKTAGSSNLQELASATNKEVKTNAAFNLGNPTLEGSVKEPNVGGAIIGLADGSISEVIPGKFGAYVVQLNSKTIPESGGAVSAGYKNSLKVPFNYYGAIEDMKDKADVKDTRYMFY